MCNDESQKNSSTEPGRKFWPKSNNRRTKKSLGRRLTDHSRARRGFYLKAIFSALTIGGTTSIFFTNATTAELQAAVQAAVHSFQKSDIDVLNRLGVGDFAFDSIFEAGVYNTVSDKVRINGDLGLVAARLAGFANKYNIPESELKQLALDIFHPTLAHEINHRSQFLVGNSEKFVVSMSEPAWAIVESNLPPGSLSSGERQALNEFKLSYPSPSAQESSSFWVQSKVELQIANDLLSNPNRTPGELQRSLGNLMESQNSLSTAKASNLLNLAAIQGMGGITKEKLTFLGSGNMGNGQSLAAFLGPGNTTLTVKQIIYNDPINGQSTFHDISLLDQNFKVQSGILVYGSRLGMDPYAALDENIGRQAITLLDKQMDTYKAGDITRQAQFKQVEIAQQRAVQVIIGQAAPSPLGTPLSPPGTVGFNGVSEASVQRANIGPAGQFFDREVKALGKTGKGTADAALDFVMNTAKYKAEYENARDDIERLDIMNRAARDSGNNLVIGTVLIPSAVAGGAATVGLIVKTGTAVVVGEGAVAATAGATAGTVVGGAVSVVFLGITGYELMTSQTARDDLASNIRIIKNDPLGVGKFSIQVFDIFIGDTIDCFTCVASGVADATTEMVRSMFNSPEKSKEELAAETLARTQSEYNPKYSVEAGRFSKKPENKSSKAPDGSSTDKLPAAPPADQGIVFNPPPGKTPPALVTTTSSGSNRPTPVPPPQGSVPGLPTGVNINEDIFMTGLSGWSSSSVTNSIQTAPIKVMIFMPFKAVPNSPLDKNGFPVLLKWNDEIITDSRVTPNHGMPLGSNPLDQNYIVFRTTIENGLKTTKMLMMEFTDVPKDSSVKYRQVGFGSTGITTTTSANNIVSISPTELQRLNIKIKEAPAPVNNPPATSSVSEANSLSPDAGQVVSSGNTGSGTGAVPLSMPEPIHGIAMGSPLPSR